jgi:monofunctional biosynthetic peptidoglycan transglycosylase
MHKMFHRPSLKMLLRWLALFLAGCIVLSWLAVLLLRFVPPWTSAMMMERRVGAWLHG